MSDATLQARIEAAEVYERLFVPAEFQEWAPRLIAAAGIRAGDRVLDVACGTGVLARTAAERTGPSGFVAGVDANPGMIAVAAQRSPGIEWREAPAEALPYPDDSFNAVLCQFGLMFFDDRPAALREMKRVLRPGGRMAIAVWDSLERTPAYAALALLERVAGGAAADALRVPFALGDRQALAEVLARAGIAGAEITTHVGAARFPSARAMVEAELHGWLPSTGLTLTRAQVDQIVREAEHAFGPYTTAGGAVTFEAPAHIATVTKLS